MTGVGVTHCQNTRCVTPTRYRLVPYGRKRIQEYSCARHFGPIANSLLERYGGPILVYRTPG